MPIQFWRHNCRGTGVLAGAELCTTCGVQGEFDGWRLSRLESMACFQYVYGIKPLGPHRELAGRLFKGMRTGCERCSGRGLLNGEGGASWRACPQCEGTGGHWNRPLDEVDAALAQVLEAFPDAEPPKGTINFMSSALAHDLGNNVMIDAAPQRRPVYGTRAPARPGGAGAPSSRWAWLQAQQPEPKRRRRKTRKLPRTPGHSKHGLSFIAVAAAFAEAERALGKKWKLKGRGHCRRVSLAGCYSRRVRAAISSWEWVSCCLSPVGLVPLALVERAAQILNVAVEILVGQEY